MPPIPSNTFTMIPIVLSVESSLLTKYNLYHKHDLSGNYISIIFYVYYNYSFYHNLFSILSDLAVIAKRHLLTNLIVNIY